MDYSSLKTEIQTDPHGIGYAGKGDYDIALLLNQLHQEYSVREPVVPIWRILAWSAQNNRLAAIQQAADSPSQIQAVALAALKVFGTLQDFDVDDPSATGLLAALVAANVLSSDDQTAFTALGDRSPASRAEYLFGAGVTINDTDVAIALRGGN